MRLIAVVHVPFGLSLATEAPQTGKLSRIGYLSFNSPETFGSGPPCLPVSPAAK
jgi:hypothetical protein